jgi:hypothetical protein
MLKDEKIASSSSGLLYAKWKDRPSTKVSRAGVPFAVYEPLRNRAGEPKKGMDSMHQVYGM